MPKDLYGREVYIPMGDFSSPRAAGRTFGASARQTEQLLNRGGQGLFDILKAGTGASVAPLMSAGPDLLEFGKGVVGMEDEEAQSSQSAPYGIMRSDEATQREPLFNFDLSQYTSNASTEELAETVLEEEEELPVENVTPRQRALVDAADISKKQAKVDSDTVLKNLKASLPAEDSSWLDKLSNEFDLTTVGMALLASNDGSKPFSANLGDALMAGRAAHKRDLAQKEAKALFMEDRATAKEQREFSNAATLRQLSAEEARARAAGKTAEASGIRSKATLISALAQANAAAKKATGFSTKTPSKNDLTALTNEIQALAPDLKFDPENTSDITATNYIHRNLQLREAAAKQAGESFTDADRVRAIRELLSQASQRSSGFLGTGIGASTTLNPGAIPGGGSGALSPEIQAILDSAQRVR